MVITYGKCHHDREVSTQNSDMQIKDSDEANAKSSGPISFPLPFLSFSSDTFRFSIQIHDAMRREGPPKLAMSTWHGISRPSEAFVKSENFKYDFPLFSSFMSKKTF